MLKTFNANWQLSQCLHKMIVESGQELRPVQQTAHDKSQGFMGGSGMYTVGKCLIEDYGHYYEKGDVAERHLALRSYDGYRTLLKDEQGGVYLTPKGFSEEDYPRKFMTHEIPMSDEFILIPELYCNKTPA